MTPCGPCPALHGIKNGCDPETIDLMNNVDFVNDEKYKGLYCPWKDWRCPTEKRMRVISRKCHAAGKSIPFKLAEEWKL
jgi:hypothetical protein